MKQSTSSALMKHHLRAFTKIEIKSSLKDSMDKPKSFRIMCGITKIKHGLILSKHSAKAHTVRRENRAVHSQIQHLTVLLGRGKQCPEGEILIFTRIECTAVPALLTSSGAMSRTKQPTAHCTSVCPSLGSLSTPIFSSKLRSQALRYAGLSCNIP